MCLVDPEAVNLVILNRYRPHLFPTDKSGLTDNYIFFSMSVKKRRSMPFPSELCFGPWDSSSGIDWVGPPALGSHQNVSR